MGFVPVDVTVYEPLDQWLRMLLDSGDVLTREVFPRTRPAGPDNELRAHILAQQIAEGLHHEQLLARLAASPEAEANRVPPAPSPPPPKVIAKEHRADMLTCILPYGKPEIPNHDPFNLQSPEVQRTILRTHYAAGFTRYFVACLQERTISGSKVINVDLFRNPDKHVPMFDRIQAEGLGSILLVGPEDSKGLYQSHYKTFEAYVAAVVKALRLWRRHGVVEVWLGVEASEYWRAAQILTLAEAIRAVAPGLWAVALHLNSGKLLPDDVSRQDWWRTAKAAGINRFAYQANHPSVEDSGGAFLADPKKLAGELRRAVDYAGKYGVGVYYAEGAYFGKRPSAATLKRVSEVGYQLGEIASKVAGLKGSSNGGPGIKRAA